MSALRRRCRYPGWTEVARTTGPIQPHVVAHADTENADRGALIVRSRAYSTRIRDRLSEYATDRDSRDAE